MQVMPAPDPSDPAIKTQRQPLEKCHSPIVRKLDKEGYFMHGAEARKVRAFNTQFNFEHVDDISSSRPGLFDGAYPPLFEEGSLLHVTATKSGYGFSVRCSINIEIMQLLTIAIAENTFSVRLSVTTHWITHTETVGRYANFFDEFKPKVVLLNRVGMYDTVDSDLYANATIKRQTVRPVMKPQFTKNDKDAALSRHVDKAVLTHFSITMDTTAMLRQAYELYDFPFDNQALGIWVESRPVSIWGRSLVVEFEHPTLVLGDCKNQIAHNADWIGDYTIEALLCLRVKNKEGLADKYVATVFVSREATAFVANIMLPVLSTIILSVAAYFVDPCTLADRMSITLTLFLTQAAFMVVVQDQLPTVPYLTPIEQVIVGLMLWMMLQAIAFIRVRALCLHIDDLVDHDVGRYFRFGMDPESNLRYQGQSVDVDVVMGLLTIFYLIVCVIYLLVKYFNSCSYKERFKEKMKTVEDPDDMESEADYYHYIEKQSSIKVRSKAFSNEQIDDIEHTNTAYKFHSRMNSFAEGRESETEGEIESASKSSKGCHAALIFDCGTGSTKAIFVLCENDEISVVEPDEMQFGPLSEVGDVSLLLQNDLESVCKDNFPEKQQDAENALKNLKNLLQINRINSVDDLHDVLTGAHREYFIASYREIYEEPKLPLKLWLDLEKASDRAISRTKAIYNTNNKNNDDEKVNSTESVLSFFESCLEKVQNCQKDDITEDKCAKYAEKKLHVPKDCYIKVVIGASAWYRNSYGKPEHEEQKLLLDGILKLHEDWRVERLTDLDECWYEMRACIYAWRKYSRSEEKLERLVGVLGVGSGSTQYSAVDLNIVQEYQKGSEKMIEYEKKGVIENRTYEKEYEDRKNEQDDNNKIQKDIDEKMKKKEEELNKDELKPDERQQKLKEYREEITKGREVRSRVLREVPENSNFFLAIMKRIGNYFLPNEKDGSLERKYQKYASARESILERPNFIPNMLEVGNGSGTKQIESFVEEFEFGELKRLTNEEEIEKKIREKLEKKTEEVKEQYEKAVQAWTKATFMRGINEGDKDRKDGKMPYLEGFVVMAISANAYGAQATDILLKDQKGPSESLEVKDVIERFKEKCDKDKNKIVKYLVRHQQNALQEKEEPDLKDIKKVAKEISNLSYLSVLYNELFDEKVKIKFARNWLFKTDGKEEKVPFRTTWTSGWFLDHQYSTMT